MVDLPTTVNYLHDLSHAGRLTLINRSSLEMNYNVNIA
jgi:hypothetical protein